MVLGREAKAISREGVSSDVCRTWERWMWTADDDA